MTDQHSLTEFNAETPRLLHERASTADTGCACPKCHANIASTHGVIAVQTQRIVTAELRSAIDTSTVRANGWMCEDCGVVVPRDMERPNSCWSTMTNSDERYLGILIDRPTVGDQLLAAIDRHDVPAAVVDEFSIYCPSCGTEYGGCVTEARIPCRSCRGDDPYRRWTKPWGAAIRTRPLGRPGVDC